MATDPQARISRFVELVRTGKVARKNAERSGLRFAIDLGTANIVPVVVGGGNRPVVGGRRRANVVRDGIVIDQLGAVTNVQEILTELHDRLGHVLTETTVITPPGIGEGAVKVFTDVLDACELDLREVVDESVVTVRVLGATDGTIIDIGHGTTGMSWLRDEVVDFSTDKPTGDYHMTLVLPGASGMGYDETETFEYDPANVKTVFPMVRPTLEEMAIIAEWALGGIDSDKMYLVGDSASPPEASKASGKVLGVTADRPEEPFFPTPLGAAMRSSR